MKDIILTIGYPGERKPRRFRVFQNGVGDAEIVRLDGPMYDGDRLVAFSIGDVDVMVTVENSP